jgi:hypothetical protein
VEVHYELTFDDLLSVSRFTQSHPDPRRPKSRPPWWFWVIFAVVVTPLVLPEFVPAGPWADLAATVRGWALAFLAGALFLGLLLFVWVRRIHGQTRRREWEHLQRSGRLAGLRMEVKPEALVCHSSVSTSIVRWPGVDRIETTRQHAYFFIAPLTAFVLPARAFAGEEEFEAFVERARSYHEDTVPVLSPANPAPERGARQGITAAPPSRPAVSPRTPSGLPPRPRPPSPP